MSDLTQSDQLRLEALKLAVDMTPFGDGIESTIECAKKFNSFLRGEHLKESDK